ncbi:hypothetical protein LSUE1_G005835 [Lachnellula suecica]|uniref:Heterokaryon incompatibility domain-containing protein n=1 Tax=Lachnellula suecica TaxID=602035 RepID=A0A8T9C8U3_9HELO|nr:hypothetical protein LSUE1_G005835 [Lachnellula suecica]
MFVSDMHTMADLNEHRRFSGLDRTIPGTITVEKHMIFSYLMIKLTLGTKPNPRDIRDVNLELALSLMRSDYDDLHEQVGTISRTTDSEQSWTLAKSWIEVCAKSHTTCHVSLSERRLPTRLVNVGGGENFTGPRLVLTDGMELSTPYLSLSHCWGKAEFMTLKRDNIEKFLDPNGMPSERLTKTFQEAIYTTRKLGYRYIWIDSLCIIQDDLPDWKRESAMMGDVYANSELNLAAADSPDGSCGLFFNRSQKKTTGWKVKCRADADSAQMEIWDCLVKYWASDLTTNVLNSRAWVFQERFLVRRSLSFGSNELAWECRAKQGCETFPNSIKHGMSTIPAIANLFLGKSSPVPPENPVNNSKGWENVVTNYSGQHLSFPSDKLVAISGIARLFGKRYKQQYLAGLWDKDLIRQLNWSSMRPGVNLRHVGRAPSWSWASTDNFVSYDNTLWGAELHLNALIENIAMVPVEDPFSSSKGGFLRLRCQTLPRGTVTPYDGIPGLKFSMSIYNSRIPGSGVWPDYENGDRAAEEVFYLPLVSVPPGGTETPALLGLVLQKLSAQSYSRVGSFRVFGKGSIDDLNKLLLANKDDQADNFKEGAREESWNGPCFTIQIV